METLRASGQVIGPGIGGARVSLVGAAAVVLIQSATFAVSAVSLLAIRTREPVIPVHPDRPKLWTQILDELAFVGRNRILRATALASAVGNFCFAIASAVTFIFMTRTLGLAAVAIGVFVAAGSVTALWGAASTPRLSRRFGSARIIWLSLAVTGPIALLIPLSQPGWGVALFIVGTAAGELGQIIYAVTNVSLRQRLCADAILGRVTATMRFLIMGLLPVGAVIGGVLGETIGLRETLWVAGGLMVLSPLPLYAALRHTRDIDDVSPWADATRIG
jgi:hypothetical protein